MHEKGGSAQRTTGFDTCDQNHSIKEKEAPKTFGIQKNQTTLAVMSCETRVTMYARKLESASNLTNPGLGEIA